MGASLGLPIQLACSWVHKKRNGSHLLDKGGGVANVAPVVAALAGSRRRGGCRPQGLRQTWRTATYVWGHHQAHCKPASSETRWLEAARAPCPRRPSIRQIRRRSTRGRAPVSTAQVGATTITSKEEAGLHQLMLKYS